MGGVETSFSRWAQGNCVSGRCRGDVVVTLSFSIVSVGCVERCCVSRGEDKNAAFAGCGGYCDLGAKTPEYEIKGTAGTRISQSAVLLKTLLLMYSMPSTDVLERGWHQAVTDQGQLGSSSLYLGHTCARSGPDPGQHRATACAEASTTSILVSRERVVDITIDRHEESCLLGVMRSMIKWPTYRKRG